MKNCEMTSESDKKVSANILDLPDEILVKIFKLAGNGKNLSLTCFRCYEMIAVINEQSVSLAVDCRYLTNPNFNLDKFLKSSNISVSIGKNCRNLANIDDKLELFLQTHGSRVTKLSVNIYLKHFATKFLPMLPNLTELELRQSFPVTSIQFPKPLRKLRCSSDIKPECLSLFAFDELELISDYYGNVDRVTQAIKSQRNLKKLTMGICNLKQDLMEIQLEQLELDYTADADQRVLENFLKSQENLRELRLSMVTTSVWTIICSSMRKLEKLTIDLSDELNANDFLQISNLKSLKHLEINWNFTLECFEKLSRIDLSDLVTLSLTIDFELWQSDIERLAVNFGDLKSLSLVINGGICMENFSKIFETFNRIESLEISFNLEDEDNFENFYDQCHGNPQLKSLRFTSRQFDLSKLIAKFTRDFPNLEFVAFEETTINCEQLERLLTGFKHLRKIDRLFINNDDCLDTLLMHGQHLEEFSMNINCLRNPNELVRDCSLNFSAHHKVDVNRNSNEKLNTIDLFTYSHWQNFRKMMDSAKRLKRLTIQLHDFPNKIALENLVECVETLSDSVTTLTLIDVTSSSQLKSIIEAVPNVQTLNLKNPHFSVDTEVCRIHNRQLKSLNVNFDTYLYDGIDESLKELCYAVKLTDDTLESFKLTVNRMKVLNGTNIAEMLVKFLENQRKLTSVSESRDKERWEVRVECVVSK